MVKAESLQRPLESQGRSEPSPLGSLAGRRLGRYEVLCELAQGGMATVYVARAQAVAGFERLVALKVLHPHLAHEEEFVSMFVDEARLAARIRHPHVVPTLDISDSEGDGYFIVMDYVEGDHLGRLLGEAVRRGARIPLPVASRIVIDALSGLGAAHDLADDAGDSLGLVHRDVSPANILVGTDGIARITDFGVARAESRVASTQAGQFKGKLAYMAPEQASTGECDRRSDLFAMGIVFWEVLTARRLFRADSNAATLARLLHETIPMPSAVDPSLANWDPVLEKALARDPAARFQTAEEFIEAIEVVALADGGIATPRALGSLVRDYVARKIDDEQQRIKLAVVGYGTGEIMAPGTRSSIPPMTSGVVQTRKTSSGIPLPSVRSQVAIATAPTNAGTPLLALPETAPTYVVEESTRKSSLILAAALVGVAVMAALAGYFASRANQPAQQMIIQSAPIADEPRPSGPTASAQQAPARADSVAPDSGSRTSGRHGRRSWRATRGAEPRPSATPAATSATRETASTPAAATSVPETPAPRVDPPAPSRPEIQLEDNPYER